MIRRPIPDPNDAAPWERERPGSRPGDGRHRVIGSDEDAPDDEAMDEMPDADEIAELERRARPLKKRMTSSGCSRVSAACRPTASSKA